MRKQRALQMLEGFVGYFDLTRIVRLALVSATTAALWGGQAYWATMLFFVAIVWTTAAGKYAVSKVHTDAARAEERRKMWNGLGEIPALALSMGTRQPWNLWLVGVDWAVRTNIFWFVLLPGLVGMIGLHHALKRPNGPPTPSSVDK